MKGRSVTGEHFKISPTARLVAYFRSFSDIPYAKDVSDALGAEKTARALLGDDFEVMTRFAGPFLEARYKCFNPMLKGAKNILELAVGTSVERGLDLTDNPRVIYVGTDLPGMIEDSSAFLRTIARPRPNYFLQAANALSYSDLERATSHFKGRKDLVIIHEGLWQYLTLSEQTILAKHIHTLLSTFGGAWVTPDISDDESRAQLFGSLGPEMRALLPRLMKSITEATGRNPNVTPFATKVEALEFFSAQGFNVREYPMVQNLTELSSIKTIGWSRQDRARYEPLLLDRPVWVMTPQ